MKILLVGLGSAGDVHPFMALAETMAARGHAVELLANPVFEQEAAACGLPFHPIGTRTQSDQTMDHPGLWHPIDGFGVMYRHLLRPAIQPVFDRIQAVAAEGPCAVVATPVAFGARVAQEALGVPLVSAYTAATMLRSCDDPLTIAQWKVPRWVPRGARRKLWSLLDRHKLEPMVRGDLHAVRAPLQLPPVTQSIFGEWMHSTDGGCTLFPDWFAPAASDWPSRVVQTGFPVFDANVALSPDTAPPPELAAFMAAGPKPIVFTPGTAMRHGGHFFDAAVQVCRQLGVRGIYVGQGIASGVAPPDPARDGFLVQAHVPFGWLFPKAAAVVHHGGIGTCAQGLRAGLPHLVLPRAYDQFDNANRLEALGVGETLLKPSDLPSMAARLRRLLHDPAVAASCQRAAGRVDSDAARESVCRFVEALA